MAHENPMDKTARLIVELGNELADGDIADGLFERLSITGSMPTSRAKIHL